MQLFEPEPVINEVVTQAEGGQAPRGALDKDIL